jgi:hypothetical protein
MRRSFHFYFSAPKEALFSLLSAPDQPKSIRNLPLLRQKLESIFDVCFGLCVLLLEFIVLLGF